LSDWQVPLSDLDYGVEEEEAALRVLRSKWLSMGPEVEAFEQEFAQMLSVKHAFAVANGTAAIHLAYLALGLGPGDEIIQPAINFVAAANMTRAVGAEPVFAEIMALHEPMLDPSEIERRITPRTRAVMVMHYGGYLCPMDEIAAITRQHGLAIVEDACHAVGAWYGGTDAPGAARRPAGTLGDVGCFSFFSNKNLPVGEGGMVVTDRADLAESVRRLRSHGMTTLTWDRHRGHAASYDVVLPGLNYRFDELRAALGRVQLRKLAAGNARRRAIVAQYRAAFSEMPRLEMVCTLPARPDAAAYHLFPVRLVGGIDRQQLMADLRARGVQSSMHYPPIHLFSAYQKDGANLNLPRSEEFGRTEVTLPLFPSMTAEQIALVVDAVGAALHNGAN
jgi:dTDP-4-amino-4,6-dideoxygalactose transaminase